MPVDQEAFDKQFHDISHGMGKQRTVASGLFLVAMERVLTPPYSIVAAWQEGHRIGYTLRIVEGETAVESWHTIQAEQVTAETVMDVARDVFRAHLEYERNPPHVLRRGE